MILSQKYFSSLITYDKEEKIPEYYYRVFNLKVDHFDHMLQNLVLKEELQNTTEIDP